MDIDIFTWFQTEFSPLVQLMNQCSLLYHNSSGVIIDPIDDDEPVISISDAEYTLIEESFNYYTEMIKKLNNDTVFVDNEKIQITLIALLFNIGKIITMTTDN